MVRAVLRCLLVVVLWYSTTASTQIFPPADVAVHDLPLVEMPVQETQSDTLAVILSGDGGWVSIDRDIGQHLTERGIAVVGLNSLQYFWTRRTPDGASADLARILRHYLTAWRKEHVLLIGFSLGADVLPALANRLPSDLTAHVQTVALLGPATTVEFEFHVADWLGMGQRAAAQPVQPEVDKLKGQRILYVYGTDESDSLCRRLDPKAVTVMPLTGGHHFSGKYQVVVDAILQTGTTGNHDRSMGFP